MKKLILLSGLMLLASLNFAFLTVSEGIDAMYGVSSNDPCRIELRLNRDFSFTYEDHSIPARTVKVQGTYHLKKDHVSLHADDDSVRFHDRWKIIDNGKRVRGSRGLSFYFLERKN